jgi:hypothetical protein
MFTYAMDATNPLLRRIAAVIKQKANSNDSAGVKTEIVKFVTACHALGIGPGVKGFA